MFCPTLRASIRVIRGISSLQFKEVTELLVPTNHVFQTNFENRRSIYSDEFLRVDVFNKTSKHIRFATTDEEAFKANIKAAFEKSRLHSVFNEDIIKLINLATSDSDFDFVRKIIVEATRDDIRSSNSYKLLAYFFMRCLTTLKVDQAKQIWNDPDVLKLNLANNSSTSLQYLTLLYRAEEYDELVKTHSTLPENKISQDTLAMAALAKIGTEEAFVKASEIMRRTTQAARVKALSSSGGRVTSLYAFFAYKLGKFGPAFDVLSDKSRVNRPSGITTNLKILILTEVGRLKDALLVIRSELLPSRDALRQSSNQENSSHKEETQRSRKKIIYMDVMKKLTDAVRNECDPELSSELMSLCKALDVTADLSEESLESKVFEQITSSSSQNRKRIDTSERRRHERTLDAFSD